MPLSFVMLKYKENSTYFSGSKGGKKSIINMHKKNKSPPLCKVLVFEIVLGNERTDFTEEIASMSVAGTGNIFSNMCV